MENFVDDVLDHFYMVLDLYDFCSGSSMSDPVCYNFWLNSTVLILFLVSLLLVWFWFALFRDKYRLYQQEKRRLELLKVADAEVLDRLKWRGVDSELVDLSQNDLAEKIRQQIKS